MSDQFPSNSHSSRRPKKPKEEEVPEKKIEKIVQADVIRRKPTLSRRLGRIFFGSDSKTVWGYVSQEVLIPAAKDTIADAVSQGVERMIFGDSRRSTSRRRGPRKDGPYISYSGYSSKGRTRSASRREEPRHEISKRARASHDFDEILLESRMEAEEVLERLFDLVSRYEVATVADLYELVGITGNYTDDKWGWYDLRSSSVRYTRYGYLLDLPRPEPLN